MRRLLDCYLAMATLLRVRSAWRALGPEEFQKWLYAKRAARTLRANRLQTVVKWSGRLADHLFPEQACVLAASTVFLFAESPVKLSVGVRREGDQLLSHAWTEWPGGELQMDRTSRYEPLWEITA